MCLLQFRLMFSKVLIFDGTHDLRKQLIFMQAKRVLSIRKHPSFIPGPRIFYCYWLLFSAAQKVRITNLHNITKEITLCSHDLLQCYRMTT